MRSISVQQAATRKEITQQHTKLVYDDMYMTRRPLINSILRPAIGDSLQH